MGKTNVFLTTGAKSSKQTKRWPVLISSWSRCLSICGFIINPTCCPFFSAGEKEGSSRVAWHPCSHRSAWLASDSACTGDWLLPKPNLISVLILYGWHIKKLITRSGALWGSRLAQSFSDQLPFPNYSPMLGNCFKTLSHTIIHHWLEYVLSDSPQQQLWQEFKSQVYVNAAVPMCYRFYGAG